MHELMFSDCPAKEVTYHTKAGGFGKRFVNIIIMVVPPIPGRVVTPRLTFSSLLTESGLHGQQGGVHIHRELTDCMIYTY